MFNNVNIFSKSNTNFYDRYKPTHNIEALSLMPSEEVDYRLDSVLPLTSPYEIVIYNNLIKFRCSHPNPSNPNNTKNISRKISTFSVNSRRNLSKHLCRIRFDQYKHRYFCTFTFHEVWPKSQVPLKKILDKFNKRLARRIQDHSYVWKLELQKRGAPHLHYFILVKNYMSYKKRTDFSQALRDSWIEAVADQDELFKKMSVDIREVANNFKTANYLTKYIAKVDDSEDTYQYGRFWAVSENLNENPLTIIKVNEDFYFKAKDKFLFFLKQKYKITNDDYHRIAMNNSLEFQQWHKDALLTLLVIARLDKLSYIRDVIQNSPAYELETSPQH